MTLAHSMRKKLTRQQSGTQYRTFLQLLHLDLTLLTLIALIITFGLFILYSAGNQSTSIIYSQLAHVFLATVIMLVLAQIPPWCYERWAPWFYGFSLIALFAVLIIGHISLGAQRWINLGIIRFQPSDLMRLAIPLVLAWYFAKRELPPTGKDLCIAAVIIIIPAMITAKEPDLGSAIIIVAGGLCILLFAGMRWRLILGLGALFAVTTPFIWHVMHAYQKQRVLTFLNPERDPLGSGYHIIQSKIAIGSGGIFGKGWMHGTQSHLHFLPEHATDFIFAVSGEELGFIGCSLLLTIYLLIVARCLFIASQAQDTFSRLLAGGLGLLFFVSVFVNMGMVTGILPVVGLPLPLISYGGSSMLTLLAGFGILMSIHRHKKLMK
jgi:rod shape determining protein RodA